jgi:hypothetical protein
MTTLYVVLGGLFAVALPYELYTLYNSDLWTISAAMRHLGQEWSLFAPYSLSVLLGHFYVQPPSAYTLAGQVDETTEVALILWGGWAVYVIDKGLSPSLPWWGYLLFLVACMAVGAFCWTMGA